MAPYFEREDWLDDFEREVFDKATAVVGPLKGRCQVEHVMDALLVPLNYQKFVQARRAVVASVREVDDTDTAHKGHLLTYTKVSTDVALAAYFQQEVRKSNLHLVSDGGRLFWKTDNNTLLYPSAKAVKPRIAGWLTLRHYLETQVAALVSQALAVTAQTRARLINRKPAAHAPAPAPAAAPVLAPAPVPTAPVPTAPAAVAPPAPATATAAPDKRITAFDDCGDLSDMMAVVRQADTNARAAADAARRASVETPALAATPLPASAPAPVPLAALAPPPSLLPAAVQELLRQTKDIIAAPAAPAAAPVPASAAATALPPPPLWLVRVPATGETLGPFLMSALRDAVAKGIISDMDAKFARAWRVDDGYHRSMTLREALDLPRVPKRATQLACASLKAAFAPHAAPAPPAPPAPPAAPATDAQKELLNVLLGLWDPLPLPMQPMTTYIANLMDQTPQTRDLTALLNDMKRKTPDSTPLARLQHLQTMLQLGDKVVRAIKDMPYLKLSSGITPSQTHVAEMMRDIQRGYEARLHQVARAIEAAEPQAKRARLS